LKSYYSEFANIETTNADIYEKKKYTTLIIYMHAYALGKLTEFVCVCECVY